MFFFRYKLRYLLLTPISLLLVFLTILWFHRVDNSITDVDRKYIEIIVPSSSAVDPESSFDDQLAFIKFVQSSVFDIAPELVEISHGRSREPKDLYEAGFGFCYDRSRTIEKILKHYGFRVRHVFMYSTQDSNSIKAFFTPQVPSHAVTEVHTEKGWLVVDSNDLWLSLDVNDLPISIAQIVDAAPDWESIEWSENPPDIYVEMAPYTYVYGLYSRHGQFYPPYNFIPDINYGELTENYF